MKQPKQKTQPAKSARKTAKNELKARLLTTLKSVLEQDKIKLTKKIKKQSKKLFKTVASELAVVKDAVVKTEKKAVKAVTAPTAVKADAKAKTAEPAKKAAPAKPVAPKAAPAAKTTAAKPAAKSTTEKK